MINIKPETIEAIKEHIEKSHKSNFEIDNFKYEYKGLYTLNFKKWSDGENDLEWVNGYLISYTTDKIRVANLCETNKFESDEITISKINIHFYNLLEDIKTGNVLTKHPDGGYRRVEAIEPMLAKTCDLDNLKIVEGKTIVQPKIDGVRMLIKDGVAYTRAGNIMDNKYIQEWVNLYRENLKGFDGELVYKDSFDETNGFFNTDTPLENVKYYVFDRWDRGSKPYPNKITDYGDIGGVEIIDVAQMSIQVSKVEAIKGIHKNYLADGHEGTMIRNIDAPYKLGRSWDLQKLKNFISTEAMVVGFKQESNMDGELKDSMGAFICQFRGIYFPIGTGMSREVKDDAWANPKKYIGKIVEFKYKQMSKNKLPNGAVFLRFRDDMKINDNYKKEHIND